MYGLIIYANGDLRKPIPIMDSDEDGEPNDIMAIWDEQLDVIEFVTGHPLFVGDNYTIVDFSKQLS